MMMSLGNFEFSLGTAAFQQLQRSTTYSWPAQQRIRNWAGKQWTGPGDERITLEGTIMTASTIAGSAPGAHQMDSIRGIALQGFPQELTDGTGYFYGTFVIESVEDTGSIFIAEGVPQKQSFQVTLSRYVKDQTLDTPAVASSKGAALSTSRANMSSVSTGVGGGSGGNFNIF